MAKIAGIDVGGTFTDLILIDEVSGEVRLAKVPTTVDNQTIVFSPNVGLVTPVVASVGSIDWACASATNGTATTRLLANRTLGTLIAKYAPSECR